MAISPTTPKGIRTRDAILAAASDVFSRVGYIDTRIVDIVEESDLSMGAVYRYFDNKEDLFAGVIADLHEDLFDASRSTTRFETDPYQALYEANHGYLQLYYEKRHLMRAFIESTAMEPRFLNIWWDMRERHVERFAFVAERVGVKGMDQVDIRSAAQAMASLVEQSAYAWFAHEALLKKPVDVDTATRITTRAWYATFFAQEQLSLQS